MTDHIIFLFNHLSQTFSPLWLNPICLWDRGETVREAFYLFYLVIHARSQTPHLWWYICSRQMLDKDASRASVVFAWFRVREMQSTI